MAKAQTWCPPGAVWHYTWMPYAADPKSGVIEDRYVGDTVVLGKTCKKIVGTFTGKMTASSPVISFPFRRSYTYLEQGVLYVYSNHTFDTVVNWNAAVGDQWLRNTLPGECNARRAVKVIYIDQVKVNDVSLKRVVTTYSNTIRTNNGPQPTNTTDEIIDRVMTTNKYIFPMYCEMDYRLDHYSYFGELICYEDDQFPMFKRKGFTDCFYITSSNELLLKEYGIRILTEEKVRYLEIKKAGTYSVRLTTIMDKKIKEWKNAEGKQLLTLKGLDDGLYLLKITTPEGLVLTIKIGIFQ
jgi:hypothetical protein